MDYIKPQKLSRDFIRRKAEEFRKEFVRPPNQIPVPIIDIIELTLGNNRFTVNSDYNTLLFELYATVIF